MANILVVGDDMADRSLKLLLARNGHSVRQAANARGAMRAQRRAPADLVILDRAGPDALTDLRRRDGEVPILALTGWPERVGERSAMLAALDSGADAVLPRPAAGPRLLDVVERLLASFAPEPVFEMKAA